MESEIITKSPENYQKIIRKWLETDKKNDEMIEKWSVNDKQMFRKRSENDHKIIRK